MWQRDQPKSLWPSDLSNQECLHGTKGLLNSRSKSNNIRVYNLCPPFRKAGVQSSKVRNDITRCHQGAYSNYVVQPEHHSIGTLRGTGTRGCAIFSQKYISVHNSFMLALIDLVMVSKESSFKELSNGMHFN